MLENSILGELSILFLAVGSLYKERQWMLTNVYFLIFPFNLTSSFLIIFNLDGDDTL